MRQAPVREAMNAAAPVLAAIGAALPAGAEVVIVPGNHDHHLLDGWLARRGAEAPPEPLQTESPIDWQQGEPLAAVANALGLPSIRAAYPGVWLRDDVYATHGHYTDRHTTIPMFERLGAGAMARLLRKPADEAACAEDYEAVLGPVYAWLHATAQSGTPARGNHSDAASARIWRQLKRGARQGGWRRVALRLTFPVIIATLNRAGLGPLSRRVDAGSIRRAPLLALSEVTARLQIDATYVIFGHTHRAGPLPGDDPADWTTAAGARILNSGSWVHEPGFLGADPTTSPFRAGFAVRVGDSAPPELVNLLGEPRHARAPSPASPMPDRA